MGITPLEFQQIIGRLEKNNNRPTSESKGQCSDELKLHNDIIEWCNAQWPRVKYIHAHTGRRSTIALGAQDFTLFLPKGRVVCIECKKKNGKRSEDQLIWAAEMRKLEHDVYEVRSMEEFLCLISLLKD